MVVYIRVGVVKDIRSYRHARQLDFLEARAFLEAIEQESCLYWDLRSEASQDDGANVEASPDNAEEPERVPFHAFDIHRTEPQFPDVLPQTFVRIQGF